MPSPRKPDSSGQPPPIATKFPLGRLMVTTNAVMNLTPEDFLPAVDRHQRGDWGAVDDHDRQANEDALREGTRLLSVYHAENGLKFWIITEADRSATTIMLPADH